MRRRRNDSGRLKETSDLSYDEKVTDEIGNQVSNNRVRPLKKSFLEKVTDEIGSELSNSKGCG